MDRNSFLCRGKQGVRQKGAGAAWSPPESDGFMTDRCEWKGRRATTRWASRLNLSPERCRRFAPNSKAIVGQGEVVDGVLIALLAGGHVLLEGAPGLGKTMLVRTLAQAVALKYSRIQFTPDLMPADVIGNGRGSGNGEGRNRSVSNRAPYSLIYYLLMKLIEPRPRRNQRCWRRCRKSKSR